MKMREVLQDFVLKDSAMPASDFGLPKKASAAIKIVAPRTESTPSPSSAARNDIISTGARRSATTTPLSTLDVYAKNYVPIWMTAVNDCPAYNRYCTPLTKTNYAEYTAKFAGGGILTRVDDPRLPTLTTTPTTTPPIGQAATAPQQNNYQPYFSDALQNELSSQAEELSSLSMYNIPLTPANNSPNMYNFTIPGVRESMPRIDLGDEILIRPILQPPGGHPELMLATRAWYGPNGGKAHGVPAPAFSGEEFQAVVWGLVRSREQVLLRIDGLIPNTFFSCNMNFVVQAGKCTPLLRSVQTTAELLSQDPDISWLRPMLFPEKLDGVIQTSLPKGNFDMKWYDELLNYEQQKAIDAIVDAKYGRVPYLISGPPGTGKTKTIVEAVLQLLLRENAKIDPHILVCAPSDSAADTLASRLSKHLRPTQLFRLNSSTRLTVEVPGTLLPYTYMEKDLFALPDFATLMGFSVVVTTCRDADILVLAQLTNRALFTVASKTLPVMFPSATVDPETCLHWTALLLDEAAQSTEPEALIPISVVNPPIPYVDNATSPISTMFPQIVMAGDEKQLGPLVSVKFQSALKTSLFARLFARTCYAAHPFSRTNGLRPALTSSNAPFLRPAFTNLIRNYRSHPAILTTPSVLFYSDTLVPECIKLSEPVKTWQGWRGPSFRPVLFLQCPTPDMVESLVAGNGTGAGGLFNPGEAATALMVVKDLLNHSILTKNGNLERVIPKEIVIMSPFRSQVNHLRQVFRQSNLFDVNIGPVEAFQGLESRIVMICTTRTRRGPSKDVDKFVKEDQMRSLGIVDEPNRFNVALTRAREGLIVIGDARCLTCTGDTSWLAFLNFCKRNGCFVEEDGNIVSLQPNGESGRSQQLGRLELALNYRDEFSARADVEGTGFGNHRNPGRLHNGTLRRPMLSTDEEIWENGMRMADEDDGDGDGDGDGDEDEEEEEEVRDTR